MVTARSIPREALSALYARVRAATLRLCEPLSPEDQVVQSMPDASPTKWHLAHTTWFFETFVLLPGVEGYEPLHPEYAVLFNSYYQGVGPQFSRPRRGLLSRPGVDEIRAYRAHVDAAMERLFRGATESSFAELAARIELGLHHEEQHQELIVTDLKHMLAQNPLCPVYVKRARSPFPPAEGLPSAGPPVHTSSLPGGGNASTVNPRPTSDPPSPARGGFGPEVKGGVLEIGAAGEGFFFDNEAPRHKVYAEPFELGRRLVTAGEYREFMDDGGYARPDLWLSEGFALVRAEGWQSPLYWQSEDGDWTMMTLSGRRPVEPDEPVCHVSYYEADAYARWAGARLPREDEWEIVAAATPVQGHFLDDALFHPAPARPAEQGLSQLFGDAWEWTASAYLPYPGFAPLPGALGEYNGKFMSGQMVLRGGSCATPERHIRATYRNFFPPSARWQFSGIRLAK